jgi:histidyl-tRNA synthetase
VKLPALGFGMGDVVLLELLKHLQLLPAFKPSLDVFVVVEDEQLRPESLRLIHDLRRALRVDYSLTPARPDKQIKRALELGARFAAKVQRSDAGTTQ